MTSYIIWFAIFLCFVIVFWVVRGFNVGLIASEKIDRIKVDSNSVENAIKEAEVKILKKSV